MEQYFDLSFEVIRHERSLILLLRLVEPEILRQSKFTDHESNIVKIIALRICIHNAFLREYCFRFVRKTIF